MNITRRWLVALLLLVGMAIPAGADSGRIARTTVSGMTILLQQTSSDLAEVTLLLKSGSGLDGAQNGVAELMNNLVYLKLVNAQNELGQVRVATLPDFTQIQITTAAKDLRDVLAEIRDLLATPLYSYDIITDLQKFFYSDLKGMAGLGKTYYALNRGFYGSEHPYNNEIDPEALLAISGHDVYRWYRRTYQPGNAILSISGDVKEDIRDLEKFFANLLSESVDRRLLIQPVRPTENQWLDAEDPNGRISSFGMAFAAPRMQDPEYPAFRIIAYYLQDYQHFFEELRVKEGLLYTAMVDYSYLERFQAPNLLFLTMTDAEKLPAVESGTLAVIEALRTDGIEAALIAKIAQAIEASGRASRTGDRGAAARNAFMEYLQNPWVDDEYLWPKLNEVTPGEIKEAAVKYLGHYIQVAYIPVVKADNL